jgi:DNA-binding SARP family transcriptional activator
MHSFLQALILTLHAALCIKCDAGALNAHHMRRTRFRQSKEVVDGGELI